jgi:hypothetical protein
VSISFAEACFISLAVFSGSQAAFGKDIGSERYCGTIESIQNYSFGSGSDKFDLPENTVIIRGNHTLHRDEKPTKWEEPYSYARVAKINGYFLILTGFQDCIDLHERRLFIVQSGKQVIEQPLWTANWNDGFFFIDKRLTYWSEWFCNIDNPERLKDKSYVFSLNLATARFDKIVVASSRFCHAKSRPKFIQFERPTVR